MILKRIQIYFYGFLDIFYGFIDGFSTGSGAEFLANRGETPFFRNDAVRDANVLLAAGATHKNILQIQSYRTFKLYLISTGKAQKGR